MIRRSPPGQSGDEAIAMALLGARAPPVWKNSAVPVGEKAGEYAASSRSPITRTGVVRGALEIAGSGTGAAPLVPTSGARGAVDGGGWSIAADAAGGGM